MNTQKYKKAAKQQILAELDSQATFEEDLDIILDTLATQVEKEVREELVDRAWEYCVKAMREECGGREEMREFITQPNNNTKI